MRAATCSCRVNLNRNHIEHITSLRDKHTLPASHPAGQRRCLRTDRTGRNNPPTSSFRIAALPQEKNQTPLITLPWIHLNPQPFESRERNPPSLRRPHIAVMVMPKSPQPPERQR